MLKPLFSFEETVGEVKLSFFFESEDGRLPHGQTCDPWPYTKCDVYLTICVSSQDVGYAFMHLNCPTR